MVLKDNFTKSRVDVVGEIANSCMKELYANCQPHVDWEDFVQQNKDYDGKGPRPYEFYYLPRDVFNDIVESYVSAYKIKSEFRPNLDTLKSYFNDPIRDKFIEKEGQPGYRGYEHFTPLKEVIGEDAYKQVINYIEEAKKFYNTDYYYNSFSMTVYLGASPNSCKEAVIENWKKYRNKDITIDESEWYEDEV